MEIQGTSQINSEVVASNFSDGISKAKIVTTEISQVPLNGVLEVLRQGKRAGALTVLDIDVAPSVAIEEAKLGSMEEFLACVMEADVLKPCLEAAEDKEVIRYGFQIAPDAPHDGLARWPEEGYHVVTFCAAVWQQVEKFYLGLAAGAQPAVYALMIAVVVFQDGAPANELDQAVVCTFFRKFLAGGAFGAAFGGRPRALRPGEGFPAHVNLAPLNLAAGTVAVAVDGGTGDAVHLQPLPLLLTVGGKAAEVLPISAVACIFSVPCVERFPGRGAISRVQGSDSVEGANYEPLEARVLVHEFFDKLCLLQGGLDVGLFYGVVKIRGAGRGVHACYVQPTLTRSRALKSSALAFCFAWLLRTWDLWRGVLL